MRRRARIGVALGLLVPMIACGNGEPEAAPPAPPDPETTPLTREEIELQAEAMSPAVAESLGIVDSTILIERPISDDTILLPPFLIDSVPSP